MFDSVRIGNGDGGIIEMVPAAVFGAKSGVVTRTSSGTMMNYDGCQVV